MRCQGLTRQLRGFRDETSYCKQGSDEGSPSPQSDFPTCADHSYEFSALIEGFDKRLDEGRLRNSLGALQAAWDNNGIVFFLERIIAIEAGHVDDRNTHTATWVDAPS